MFTATTKAIGWSSKKHGKKTCVYDKPRTPYQRVIDSGVMTTAKAAEFAALFEATNPAELTRKITAIQKPSHQPCERENQSDYRQHFASKNR
jgi:hypothetical protein